MKGGLFWASLFIHILTNSNSALALYCIYPFMSLPYKLLPHYIPLMAKSGVEALCGGSENRQVHGGKSWSEKSFYLSDYKEGAFGRSTGLLIDGPRLLARSIVLVDKQGIVRYIQVVPDITHLPDMDKAFAKAIELDNLP